MIGSRPPTARVQRTDFAGVVRGVTETPQGGLRMPAALTRVGVLQYQDATGRTWGELRHPDEVFDAASLASLRASPVTDLHPDVPVSSENFRALAVGHVHDDVSAEDGRLVVATLTVQDAAAVAKIHAGDRREISCGYDCEVEPAAGVWEGVPYEGIQRRIVYNHVAIGPGGWGRAGSEVSLRMDGAAVNVRGDARKEPVTMKVLKIRGREYKLDAPEDVAAAQAAASEMEKKGDTDASELAAVKAALMDALQKVAALEAKQTAAAAAQPTVTEAMVPDEVADALVAKRLALRERAIRVLPAGTKLDGQSAAQIHRTVVAAKMPAMKLDGLSDATVEGMFLALTETAHTDALAEVHRAATGHADGGNGGEDDDHDGTPEGLRRRTEDAWKRPSAVTVNTHQNAGRA